MGNPLNLYLEGKIVVMNPKYYNIAYLFKCESGFGCYPFTSGTSIFGTFLYDNEHVSIDSSHILRLATEKEIASNKVGDK